MQLEAYPTSIASSETILLGLKQQLQAQQDELDILTHQIESEIAFDANLKNDAQRKARRFELMQSEQYVKSATELRNLQTAIAIAEIDTRSLLNQFTIAKLQFRHEIAQLEHHQ